MSQLKSPSFSEGLVASESKEVRNILEFGGLLLADILYQIISSCFYLIGV